MKASVLGRDFLLRTDEDESVIIDAVRTVDKRLADVVDAMPSRDAYAAAVLLAIELAGELKKTSIAMDELKNRIMNLDDLISSKITL